MSKEDSELWVVLLIIHVTGFVGIFGLLLMDMAVRETTLVEGPLEAALVSVAVTLAFSVVAVLSVVLQLMVELISKRSLVGDQTDG